MDLKSQIIQEYLMQGGSFRKLAEKYGISRTQYGQTGNYKIIVVKKLQKSRE